MAPLISDSLGLGTLSVGPQYFNPTFLLPMLPLIALAAIGMHANWKRGRLPQRKRPLIVTGLVALAVSAALVFGYYAGRPGLALMSLALGIWLVLSSLIDPVDRLRRGLTLPRAIVGMTLAHVALGVFVIAVTAVETYTTERDVALARGEVAHVGGYDFRFDGVDAIEGPNYDGVHGIVQVTREGQAVVTLHPEKRRYLVQQSVMTEAAIASQAGRDLFVALGEDLGAGRWSLRIQIRPLINYVWLAAALMALGGLVAASDRRYRSARAPAAEAVGPGQGSPA